MTTMSAREFNQDVSAAKRAAEAGPVIITDRGVPSHVLISYDDYLERTAPQRSLYDRLRMGEEYADVELPIEPRQVDDRAIDL